tara:strand:+ start:10440 stop:11456 length:1017 start_codon:yes stop_codon:yes gene_type:complete
MSYDIYKQQLLNVPLKLEHCVNVCKVNICYCKINTEYNNAYLEFKLFKNKQKKLTFESFDAKITKNIDIKTFIMQSMPRYNRNDILGYIIHKDAIYCFIKFDGKNQTALYKASDTSAIVISDEIVNQRHYFNIPIDDAVYGFFIKNQHCLYLKTLEGKQILAPKTYYYGDTSMKKTYLLQFGIPKQSFLGIFGSYYYISTFKDAIINAGWLPSNEPLVVNGNAITTGKDGKYIQGAIYRCILFIEHAESKILPTKDDSETTRLLIEQSNEYAIKNQHISDRGAKWSELYDTIYSGMNDNMPINMIAHKYPVFIDKYVELNMQSLPKKKTDKYNSVQIK